MDDAPAVRIFLRPFGSPLTIAMSGLAIASVVQSGLDLNWIALGQTKQVGLILVSVPFVLQLIACLFAYASRDGAAGAAVGVLAVSWLAIGLTHITSTPGSRSGALGLMLLASAAMLVFAAGAVGLSKPLVGAVFALAGARFAVTGIYELGANGTWQDAGGVIGLVVTGLAGYCSLAFEVEGQKHRPVLPTFRRGSGRAAVLGTPAEQVDGVSGEAGVRQTT
jgi:succinate-acetate transporter protein